MGDSARRRENAQRAVCPTGGQNAVEIPGPATGRLCQAAKRANVHVVIGVNERNIEAGGASLYNSLLVIDAQGNILGVHRKLMPSGAERLVWGRGDGSALEVYDTPFGKLGALTCWENCMPLARYALYAWGAQIYAAPTWDRGKPWLSTLRHIDRFYGHVDDWIMVLLIGGIASSKPKVQRTWVAGALHLDY
jgi:nitrilase